MDHVARFAIHKEANVRTCWRFCNRIPLESLLSSYFSPQISSSCSEVSVQHVQGTRVNETLTHEGR